MPRRKISEYRAKTILSQSLGILYVGWSVSSIEDLRGIPGEGKYVLKVDQAEKKRFKKGLVILNQAKKELAGSLARLQKKGYEHFIVEPLIEHDSSAERYLALSYDRYCYYLSFSARGGVDIESNPHSIKTIKLDDTVQWGTIAKETGLSVSRLEALLKTFQDNYFTFLEINPYIVAGDQPYLIDTAVEVDDAGGFFTSHWSWGDIRTPVATRKTAAEEVVARLDEKSPASFNLNVLNPDGSIFLLLSGGGASVVVADEIYNHGLGREIANYGEYSGNPREDETYIYTSAIVDILLASKAKKKVLFIGGAVANFTDIANTFAGITRVLDERHLELAKQKVRVFVRRGGPRQEIGLKKIFNVLDKYGLLGEVNDPNTSINEAIDAVMKEVKT